MFGLGMKELLVVGGIFTLLFGAKQIPKLARGFGQAVRELRGINREFEDEEKENKK